MLLLCLREESWSACLRTVKIYLLSSSGCEWNHHISWTTQTLFFSLFFISEIKFQANKLCWLRHAKLIAFVFLCVQQDLISVNTEETRSTTSSRDGNGWGFSCSRTWPREKLSNDFSSSYFPLCKHVSTITCACMTLLFGKTCNAHGFHIYIYTVDISHVLPLSKMSRTVKNTILININFSATISSWELFWIGI